MGLKEKIYLPSLIPVAVLLVIWTTFTVINPSTFLSYTIYKSILVTAPILLILALGVTYVLVSKEIDVSYGSLAGLSGLTFALILSSTGDPVLSLLGALSAGSLAGVLNGILITKLRLVSIAVTLGTMFFWRGFILVASGGSAIYLLKYENTAVFNVFVGEIGGFPVQMLWGIAFTVFLWLILNRHKFGSHLCYVGDNETSARLLGINTAKVKIITFGLMGLTASVVGIMSVSINRTFWTSLGGGYLLPVFAVVFLGGNLPAGGKGTIFGTFIAAIVITMIKAGLLSSGVSGYWTDLWYGVIIIFSIVVHTILSRKFSKI